MKKRTNQLLAKVFFVVFLIFSVQSIQAQPQPPSVEERTEKEVARLKKDLSLSEEQEVKVKTIVQKYEEKRQTLMKEKKSDFSANISRMEELDKQKDTELKGVLTSEQYQKLQEQRSKMKKGPMKQK